MEDGSVELRTYWSLFLRWWWLFVLGGMGAAIATYYVSSSEIPTYTSTARVVVERQGTPGIPSAADFDDSAVLALNYADLIETRPVLEQIAQKLPVRYSPGAISSRIRVSNRRNIISITATDIDPVVAAVIANTTAETFIEALLNRQLSQLAQFQAVLGQYGIEQDASIVAAQAAMVGILSIVEPAVPSSSPSNGQGTTRNIIIATLAGILLSGLGVVLIEYLDTRVKSLDELKKLTGLTTIGSVPYYKSSDVLGVDTLTENRQLSHVTESYRALRTSINFAFPREKDLKTLLVTSSVAREGKTKVAINLASEIAKGGKSVILIDSDLRASSLHQVFELEDNLGLTQVLASEGALEDALVSTPIEGLKIMTSGPTPPDPTISLRSTAFTNLIHQLKNRADLLIFDSSPFLAVVDPMVLASQVDGVLLVVDAQRTGRDKVLQTVDRLKQLNPPPAFLGAVLNKSSAKESESDYLRNYGSHFGDINERWHVLGRPGLMSVFLGLAIAAGLITGLILAIVLGPLDIRSLI